MTDPESLESTLITTIDGGDRSCTTLLLELRGRLATLPPGIVVHLIATDPAAPLDLAAWCHLTGHEYLGRLHGVGDRPTYALRVNGAAQPTDPRTPWRLDEASSGPVPPTEEC